MPRYTGPGAPLRARRAASRTSLGTFVGTEASAPHLVTDENIGIWSSSWYSLRDRSARRMADVSAMTGLPDQNGSAMLPATLAAPGP